MAGMQWKTRKKFGALLPLFLMLERHFKETWKVGAAVPELAATGCDTLGGKREWAAAAWQPAV